MNRSNRPKRWQLDVFMLLMIVLMLLLIQAHLSSPWETAAEIGWSILTLAGMGLWVRQNRAALEHEDQQRHHRRPAADRDGSTGPRTVPLTPVQAHFLAAMQPTDRKKDT